MANKTIELIKQWAIDRKLDTADPTKQMWKLIEENGELAAGIAKGKPEMVEDAIGDMVVVQTILLMQVGRDMDEAMENMMGVVENPAFYKSDDDCMINIVKSIHKLFSEVQTSRDRKSGFMSIDGVTDILIELYDISYNHNMEFYKCIDAAYNEIKDRKGEMRNGVFVKAGD